jgi:hypothetical protein
MPFGQPLRQEPNVRSSQTGQFRQQEPNVRSSQTGQFRRRSVEVNGVNISLITTMINLGQIGDALRQIAEAGTKLNRTDRLKLLLLAMNELAKRVESAKDPAYAQSLVVDVRDKAPLVKDPNVDRVFAAVNAWLTYQNLVRDLNAMSEAIAKKQWEPAAQRAHAHLRRPDLAAELQTTLRDVIQVSRQFQALEQLQHVLQIAEHNRPNDTAEAFRDLQAEYLSPAVRELVRGLRGLTDVWAAGESQDRRPPDVARLKQSLADFRSGSGDAALTARVQMDLAAKWFLDGFPLKARELLPDQPSSAEYARDLVDDLKGLVLGQGPPVKVVTWPAQQALQRSPGPAGEQLHRPPPGVAKLLPANQLTNWRPPGREEKAPPSSSLQEVARREKPLREKLQAAFRTERETVQHQAEDVQDQVKTLSQRQTKQEDEVEDLYAGVEAILQRPEKLSPAEQMLAWYGYRRGQKPPVIAEILDKYQTGRLTPETPLPDSPLAGRGLTPQARRVLGAIGTAAAPSRPGLALIADLATRLAGVGPGSPPPPKLFKGAAR